MKSVLKSAVLLFFIGLQSCGSGENNVNDNSDVTVSFSLTDASTGVALNAVESATFSKEIAEPTNWLDVFTLKKDGTGDTLCTAIDYDDSTMVATCDHAELDGEGNYTAAISGLSGVTDATATFTTGSEIAVNSVEKTSVTSADSGNSVIFTLTFASALPANWVPTVEVADSDGTELTVGGCEFGDDRTTYTCTVGGIDGCTTISDYTVTVTGTGEFTTTFNSADDEFESEDALSNCWVRASRTDGTFSIDGNLNIVISYGGVGDQAEDEVSKSFSGETDIAVLVHISSIVPPSSGIGGTQITTALNECINCSGDTISLGGGYTGENKWSLCGNGSCLKPSGSTPLRDTYTSNGPFYVCMVRYNNTVKTYLSTDGSSFTRLSAENMECVGGACDLEGAVEAPAAWATALTLLATNSIAGSTLRGEYGYARFKTTGITGESSADCPAL